MVYLGPTAPATRTWHCYVSAYETIFSETVEAEDATRAAVAAAEKANMAGVWTVVEVGENGVTRIDIQEKKGYEAISQSGTA